MAPSEGIRPSCEDGVGAPLSGEAGREQAGMAPTVLAPVPPLCLPRRPVWLLHRAGSKARGHFAMVTGPQPGTRGNIRERLKLHMSFRGTFAQGRQKRRGTKLVILW